MNHQDVVSATNALKSWFQSQDMSPAESVTVTQLFLGGMIAENAKTTERLEDMCRGCEVAISALALIQYAKFQAAKQ